MCQLEENQMLPTGEGQFALKAWDGVFELECVETVVTYRPTPGECFVDIPVEGDLPFLDSHIRTLRLNSEKIACADVYDRFLKDVKGKWWRVGKQVSRTVKPREARPLAGEVHGHPLDRHMGLYTAAELEQSNKAQVIPRAKQQVLNQLIGGLCATRENCLMTSLKGTLRYSLQNLAGGNSGESNAVLANNPTVDVVGVGTGGQNRRSHFHYVPRHLGSSSPSE